MIIDHSNTSVAVTGAGSGIGLAISKAFLDSGASLLAIDRNAEALEELREAAPALIKTATTDITASSELTTLADNNTVDHLVCCAAIGSGKSGFPFWNLSTDDWTEVIEVTLMGTINTIYAFTPALLKSSSANRTITIIGSVAGQIGSQTDPPYSAAKAALINFAQCAAKDLAPEGIRVNTISPGMVKTALNESVFRSSAEVTHSTYEEWADAKIRKTTPMGRWQEPEEIGALAVFLASSHARNMTGQTLNIDGGQVMHS